MKKILMAAALVFVLAAACQNPTHVVFGDSLGAQILPVAGGDGREWHVENGADLARWDAEVNYAILSRHAVIVYALGTNDAAPWTGGWTSGDRAKWNEKVAATRTFGACAVGVLPWVTAAAEASFPGIRAGVDRARADMRAMPFDVLVDWKTVVDRHPEYVNGDGIHLTSQAAINARYQLIDSAARSC